MPQKKDTPVKCETCGNVFLARKVDIKRGTRFCSRSCASKERAHRCLVIGKTGSENPGWKGGLFKSNRGYWYVHKPDHPNAMKNGYVKRATMVLAEKIGRSLYKGEMAHHKDGNKENDATDNLELCGSHLEHASKHQRPRKTIVRKPDHPNNRRYDWPPDDRLLEMRETMTLRAIAKIIGCGHKAVDRHITRIKNC